jgi:phosphoribosylanthranilate isomerase
VTARVKVCGLTRVEDAELAVSLGAEMIGLNFYPPSPRSLTLEHASAIRRAIRNRAEVVGIFVNSARSNIELLTRELKLDYLQFHGDENDEAISRWPLKVIRALRVPPVDDRGERLSHWAEAIERCRADYVLLDTYHPELYGGTGQARSFTELGGIELSRVILSGGLTPANVGQAAALHPYAVDVASGVESAPGIKDAAKLRSFIINAKSAR